MKPRQILQNLFIIFIGIACTYTQLWSATITSSGGSSTWSDGSAWVGGIVPSNTDDAVIQSGHTITITATDTVASLTLNSSSFTILTINAGITLNVTNNVTLNSTGAAFFGSAISCNGGLVVGGNINLNAVSNPDKSVIDMGDHSSIELGGTIIFGSAGSISSGSNYYYTFTYNGSSAQTVACNDNIVYNHLILDNSSGFSLNGNINTTRSKGQIEMLSGNLSDGGYSIAGTTDSAFTITSGNSLILTATNSLPTGFNMVIEANSTINYSGTSQTVNAPNNSQNYANLVINCSGTATLGNSIIIDENLSIATGTLDASGSNYNIEMLGNWTNTSGSFIARSGQVSFTGSSSQAISTNAESFYDLVINNTSSAGITLNEDCSVSNSITFTDGVITTGAYTLTISNTSASSISGFSNASFVNGNFTRYITTNTDTYDFPIGNSTSAGNYFLSNIINNNLSGTDYITAHFGALTNHDDNDITATDAYITYQSVANNGVWFLTPNSQPSSGTYDIRLYITNFGVYISDNEFGILKRADNSTTAADWSDGGGTSNADNGLGRLVSHGYALRMGLNSFSQFGIGRASVSGNPLPITLISFTGNLNESNIVSLNWATAIEINNDYFTIEKSRDGINFETLTEVTGAGNSNIQSTYSIVDENPVAGINYYRLKQTDFDGAFEYSDMIAIEYNITDLTSTTIYPNPVNVGGTFEIKTNTTQTNEAMQVLIYTSTGALVYEQKISTDNNKVNIPGSLSSGLYLMQIIQTSAVKSEMLVIQ